MERMLSVIGTNGPKTIRGKDNLQISLTQQILIQTPLGPRRAEESGQGGSVGLLYLNDILLVSMSLAGHLKTKLGLTQT